MYALRGYLERAQLLPAVMLNNQPGEYIITNNLTSCLRLWCHIISCAGWTLLWTCPPQQQYRGASTRGCSPPMTWAPSSLQYTTLMRPTPRGRGTSSGHQASQRGRQHRCVCMYVCMPSCVAS